MFLRMEESKILKRDYILHHTQVPSNAKSWSILMWYVINDKLQIHADWIDEILEEL